MIIGLLTGCDGDDPVTPDPVPTGLIAVNGLIYKGVMGDTLLDSPLDFVVKDQDGNNLPNQQVQLDVIEGDGTISRILLGMR